MLRPSYFLCIALFSSIASAQLHAQWTITDPSGDWYQPISQISCNGGGPASSTAELYQWIWDDGDSRWESSGFITPRPVETDDMGFWTATAKYGSANYVVGEYKVSFPYETGFPAKRFDVLAPP